MSVLLVHLLQPENIETLFDSTEANDTDESNSRMAEPEVTGVQANATSPPSTATSIVSVKDLGLHGPPPLSFLHERSGRVHCNLFNSRKPFEIPSVSNTPIKASIVLSLQTNSGNNKTSVPFLFAKQGPLISNVKYTIHDVANPSITIGYVVKLHSCMSTIVYGVYRRPENTADAIISYKVPVLDTLSMNHPPRFVRVALPLATKEATAEHSKAMSVAFEKTCKESIRRTSSLTQAKGLRLMESAPAYRKVDGTFSLNFRGRGKLTSKKNVRVGDAKALENFKGQLGELLRGSASPKVDFQMAKWEDNRDGKTYNVDFAAPFSPFQAFGLALANMHL